MSCVIEFADWLKSVETPNVVTKQSLHNFKLDLEDEVLKEKNFTAVFQLLRELEGTDASIIESLITTKWMIESISEEEARLVTKEYKMGALDPTKDTTKFE